MHSSPVVTFDHGIFVAQRYGGVSRYFVELARHLQRAGAGVVVDSPVYVTDGVRSLATEGVFIRGVHVPAFPGVTRLGDALGRLLPSARSDILHETWYGRPGTRKRGIPIAVTLHDMISELLPDAVNGAALQTRRKREAVNRADIILCVSENTRRDAMRLLDLSPERLVVTPLASSLSVVPRNESGKPYVLYVGKRGGYKNFSLLLDAFSATKTLRDSFTLVCFGGGAFTVEEHQRMAQAGEVVHVDGNDQTLARCYSGARVFVSTSRYEGFGLPLLEAMSAGCPVVAVAGGSVPEVGGDSVAYIADDAGDLAVALDRLLQVDAALREATASGLERSKHYSWERTAAITLDAYRTAISV
jgi:glycosyltransferase involved in cell wall biosynthesis